LVSPYIRRDDCQHRWCCPRVGDLVQHRAPVALGTTPLKGYVVFAFRPVVGKPQEAPRNLQIGVIGGIFRDLVCAFVLHLRETAVQALHVILFAPRLEFDFHIVLIIEMEAEFVFATCLLDGCFPFLCFLTDIMIYAFPNHTNTHTHIHMYTYIYIYVIPYYTLCDMPFRCFPVRPATSGCRSFRTLSLSFCVLHGHRGSYKVVDVEGLETVEGRRPRQEATSCWEQATSWDE
jgi:hypothetical protein